MPQAEGENHGGGAPADPAAEPDASSARKRPRPGERREQILHALASMLEQPGAERVTTAALAARLSVSEAALYRHFASKAQMYEALIDFIETSVFTLVRQVQQRDPAGPAQAAHIVTLVLQFGERNPGMARVMVGDALVFENERLQQRMNRLFDKIEASLKQALRDSAAWDEKPVADAAAATPSLDAQIGASVLTAFAAGRLQRFTRSGFRRAPTEQLEAVLARLLPNS